MKTIRRMTFLAGLLMLATSGGEAATTIVGDTSNVTGSGSGFSLGSGVNTGINPPTTRLTGSAAANLRYINTGTKATTAYTLTSSKVRVAAAANAGRFTLSSNGTTPFDFGPSLGVNAASPSSPVVYDLVISIDNDSAGIQRCSFAIGTAEGDATTWDFGVQVYRAASGNNFYTIGKRIDTASSGLGSDLNAAVLNMGASTYGTEIAILMRVTDAGSETTTFNSRVQLSLNGGSTWFYDTATDTSLAGTGFRFDGAGRYVMWDVAPDAGPVTYDNLAVNWHSGPRVWTGAGANGNWNTALNWGGAVPTNGSRLTFAGTTRPVNTNDLSGFSPSSLNFSNGGFTLYGNEVIVQSGITNLGNNTIRQNLAWGTTSAKTWSLANGTTFTLDNTTAIEVGGDHTVQGNGTLRQLGALNIGQATTANPAFNLAEGKHIIEAGTFSSRGGYRIGTLSTGAGAQTIISNGSTFNLTAAGANLRVGDSANTSASQLIINNSTLSMAGGVLGIPFSAGAIGTVNQTGGTVSGAHISFSEAGIGTGSYTVKDGTLEPLSISKGTAGGSASITFDNATLRPATGASANLMTGLNTAQIQTGGLTVNATTDLTIGQGLSGSGALTKTGVGKLTLTGANTYSGATTVSAGTLAIGSGGSVASATLSLANGTGFDLSGTGGYALASSQTLARAASSSSASLVGPVTFNSGAKISLQANGSTGTIGTLSVSGGITLNSTVLTINVTGASLGAGTYTLITYSGAKTGSFSSAPTITGLGIANGLIAKIVDAAGVVSLQVQSGSHGIAAATFRVTQHDLANNADSVTVSVPFGINGMQVQDGSNRGDFNVQVGTSNTDDFGAGVLMTSVAENGRNHGEDSGINYCTSAMAGTETGGYFIPISSAPEGTEYNINVAAAHFPYSRYLAGYARNSAGTAGGANNLFTGSPGLQLGTHFIDHGDGTSTVNLLSLGVNSQTDGVLLATHGANRDNYALTRANTNGTWTVYISDNGTNGTVYEQDPVAFVYVPKSQSSVISGKFQGDGGILLHSGSTPTFSVTNSAVGTWILTIPGYTPNSGVLIISPEGGDGANADNIISYKPSGSTWIIESRDIPGTGLQTPTGPVASFVFIPAPTATLVGPANGVSNVASAPTLRVTANNPAGGNVTVRFNGHQAAKPYPGKDFMVAVLPDTQNYAREESGFGQATKEMWFAQTDWICNNRVSQNITYVATLGDCVQNADALWQWRNATNAMYRLEKQSTTKLVEGIPYGITVGNHDQDPIGDENGSTAFYNQYFGTSHFAGKSYYGGHFGSDNDNWYDLFSAGGLDFIVISFEYGRYGAAVLDWAESVLAAHQNRRLIVLTHHAADDNSDVNATTTTFSAQGSAIYERLKTFPNFFLMMSGHVFNEGGEGRRSDTFNGKTTRTLVSDYQNRMNGGNGWMRLMYFSPSNNTVSVKTYSPWLEQWETDANSQFTFTYNQQLPSGPGSPGTAYVALGTNTVAAGSQASNVWSGLQASKTYEWYVTVTDEAGDYSTSSEWQFTTTSTFARPAIADADSDGLPDDWESSYGVKNADADDDGDGQSNRAEYIAATDPTKASSVFKVLEAVTDADGKFHMKWTSMGGVRYRVQYAIGLDGDFIDLYLGDDQELARQPAGEESVLSYTDQGSTSKDARFYRVKVLQ